MARTSPCKCVILGMECSVFNGVWSAPIAAMQRVLQLDEERFRETGLRPPEPDADYASAVRMTRQFDGEVLSKPEPDSVPGRVY